MRVDRMTRLSELLSSYAIICGAIIAIAMAQAAWYGTLEFFSRRGLTAMGRAATFRGSTAGVSRPSYLCRKDRILDWRPSRRSVHAATVAESQQRTSLDRDDCSGRLDFRVGFDRSELFD